MTIEQFKSDEKLRKKGPQTAKRKADQWAVDDTVDKRGDGTRVKPSIDSKDPKDTSELTTSLVPVTKGNKEQTYLINESESSGQQIPATKNSVAADLGPITYFELKYMRLQELLSNQAEWQRQPRFGSIEQWDTETVKKLVSTSCFLWVWVLVASSGLARRSVRLIMGIRGSTQSQAE